MLLMSAYVGTTLATDMARQVPGVVIRYGNATVEMPIGTQAIAIVEILKALCHD